MPAKPWADKPILQVLQAALAVRAVTLDDVRIVTTQHLFNEYLRMEKHFIYLVFTPAPHQTKLKKVGQMGFKKRPPKKVVLAALSARAHSVKGARWILLIHPYTAKVYRYDVLERKAP